MKKILLFTVLFIQYYGFSQIMFYNVVTSETDSLYVLGDDGNVYEQSVVVETNNNLIIGFTGMAMDQVNSNVYVVAKSQGGSRFLAKLDLATSLANKIGDLADKISSISFSGDGSLYGITGDGGSNPNRLYSIDLTNAELTEKADLSGDQDNDGEALAFNTSDDFMYRMAGEEFLYKIDMTNFTTTLVTSQLLDDGASGHAMYYNGTNFITLSADICTMNSLGEQTNCNDIPFDAKGILPSDFVGISELGLNQSKELVKIVNLLGQQVEYSPNTVLIYQYSDGTSEKVFTIAD
ncbi:hypothetical protein OAM07_05710 [Crocinitomicaceae bacterium]|jgi:hypothetical protein|nr:hypothetical protein [Crocinitomicaceae bacterium]MDB4340409.1 hypothetical protein [Crocinitomicaceae bacterium]MDC0460233.1 hypothetical protein [Crocinitomicaceae bacterium]MDC3309163.1 hypothetical protein [Crocinitomicaceae bacterium]